MNIKDKLKEIDDFFDSIAIEEFEEIAISAGAEDLNKTEKKDKGDFHEQ